MPIPAKFNGDREAYKNFLRRMKQFSLWTDERLDAYIAAKGDATPGQETQADAADLETSLEAALRPYFRKEVVRILDEVVRAGGTRETMRSVAEECVYYSILLRQKLVASKGQKGDLDERGLAELIGKRISLLEMLGLTPKEQRLAGRKSDESLSGALAQALESGRRAMREATANEAADNERFNKPVADAPPPSAEPQNLPDGADGT